MIPLKKKWCCHTIDDKPEILDLAAQAGAWYVYQAVFDTSDYIRNRIKRYHDHGIKVEGTILLGVDNQTEDDIIRNSIKHRKFFSETIKFSITGHHFHTITQEMRKIEKITSYQ